MDKYYVLAKEFCVWLKQLNCISKENAESVIIKVMEIYSASTKLAYPETFSDNESPHEREFLSLFCKTDFYWEISDPFVLDAPVGGTLIDDLSDIFNDILRGINLYEQDEKDEAAWCWKWSFDNHWKYHATSAIRALCWID